MADTGSRVEKMKAVVADPASEKKLELREMERPQPAPDQALIRVRAVSLNAGDTRSALKAEEAYIPGWDYAGEIEIPAADGSSPPAGTRVVGAIMQGAWAQFLTSPSGFYTTIPDAVSFEDAAALPVAASTAMLALRQGGDLTGKRVLITGAAGGVGRYACQIASHFKAQLFAVSRRKELTEKLKADGVNVIETFSDINEATAGAKYDFILESVGGASLGRSLVSLATDGVCVTCGNSTQEETTFNVSDFYFADGVRLYGLYLGRHLMDRSLQPVLDDVLDLLEKGVIQPPIGAKAELADIDDAAARLKNQAIEGKIILTVD